jgi:hypothetical protein
LFFKQQTRIFTVTRLPLHTTQVTIPIRPSRGVWNAWHEQKEIKLTDLIDRRDDIEDRL